MKILKTADDHWLIRDTHHPLAISRSCNIKIPISLTGKPAKWWHTRRVRITNYAGELFIPLDAAARKLPRQKQQWDIYQAAGFKYFLDIHRALAR